MDDIDLTKNYDNQFYVKSNDKSIFTRRKFTINTDTGYLIETIGKNINIWDAKLPILL